jgi:hypothetical protein
MKMEKKSANLNYLATLAMLGSIIGGEGLPTETKKKDKKQKKKKKITTKPANK